MVLYEEPVKVLVIDDNQDDLQRSAAIAKAVFPDARVTTVEDYETALYYALNEYFDLVLLDLVLHAGAPGPQETLEGLWLLQEIAEHGFDQDIPIVILTGLGEDATLARHIFRNFRIVDFWAKRESDQSLVTSLTTAVARLRHFGLTCRVSLLDGLTWRTLVKALTGLFRRRAVPVSEEEAEGEIRHILRKLFADCSEIAIAPLEPGHSGAAVIRVTPTFADGSVGAEVIVKYGTAEQASREIANFAAMSRYMKGYKSTQLQGGVLGRRLGAIRYSLVGGTEARVRSFAAFYGESGVDDIERVLRALLGDTCELFYAQANRTTSAPMSLERAYSTYLNFSRASIRQAFEFKYPDKPVEIEFVEFAGIPRRFPHPVRALISGAADFEMETWSCRTHGDLHSGNILVDAGNRDGWLIDFYRSGMGHWARDFAALEACIKFQHVPARDLPALFEWEEALAAPGQLDVAPRYFREDQPELVKAVRVVGSLRRIASVMTEGWNPAWSMEEYYMALFYETLNYIRYHRLIKQPTRKNHVLLSAAILYERILRPGTGRAGRTPLALGDPGRS